MRSTIFIIAILISSSVYGQKEHRANEVGSAASKKPSNLSELIFKRMDSNKNGSISLKEFKDAFPRFRQSYSRSSQGSSQGRSLGTTPQEAGRGYSRGSGRTRGFDGKTPTFKPKGNSRSRGRSSRSYRGSSRGHTAARRIILMPNLEPITFPSWFRKDKGVLPVEGPAVTPKKVNGAIPIPWDNFLPVSLKYYS